MREKDPNKKQGLVRKARREDSMALEVKAPRSGEALGAGIPEGERCGHWLGEERCPQRRSHAEARYCELHGGWQSAELARWGAPLPVSPMSFQLFLAKAIDQVLTGQKSDVQVRAVLMLVKLMQRNAHWIWQR